MKDLIISIFGEYVPITYMTQIGEDFYDIVPSGAAGIDWEWLAGVIVFVVVLNGLMRIIHGLVNAR